MVEPEQWAGRESGLPTSVRPCESPGPQIGQRLAPVQEGPALRELCRAMEGGGLQPSRG